MEENAALPDQMAESRWELLRQGNQVAFGQLYRGFYRELYGYARRLVRQDDEARNLIQELFLSLWERHEALPEVASVKAYLFVSVRRRAPRQIDYDLWEGQDSGTFVFSAEDFLMAGEREEAVKAQLVQSINTLPERLREIIYLRYYQDLSIGEIAEALSLNYQSVANSLQRAYRSLREEKGLRMLLLAGSMLLPFILLLVAN